MPLQLEREKQANSVSTSSPLSFLPRPVMLDSSLPRANPHEQDKRREEKKKRKEEKKKKKEEKKHASILIPTLLRAISDFLERNGFVKTLSVLRSEAKSELEGESEFMGFDLKESFREYFETRAKGLIGEIDPKDETDKSEETAHDRQEKPRSKKKKGVSSSPGDEISANGGEKDVDIVKKEIQEVPEESNGGFEGQETSEKKKKSKKDKKKKGEDKNEISGKTSHLTSEVDEEKPSGQILVTEEESHDKKKKKKKRKHEAVDASSVQDRDLVKKTNCENKNVGLNSNEQESAELNHVSNGDVHTPGKKLKTEKELESNGSSKSGKSEKKQSTASKTANAFQRVKVDAVEFADSRLQDNSYWAKDGAEIGYGAKAQEVLGQVRGRDFRHEKTKKKRGSYRGGQIDFQSHSVKFQYSEDEE